jgi:hypothetical protein
MIIANLFNSAIINVATLSILAYTSYFDIPLPKNLKFVIGSINMLNLVVWLTGPLITISMLFLLLAYYINDIFPSTTSIIQLSPNTICYPLSSTGNDQIKLLHITNVIIHNGFRFKMNDDNKIYKLGPAEYNWLVKYIMSTTNTKQAYTINHDTITLQKGTPYFENDGNWIVYKDASYYTLPYNTTITIPKGTTFNDGEYDYKFDKDTQVTTV